MVEPVEGEVFALRITECNWTRQATFLCCVILATFVLNPVCAAERRVLEYLAGGIDRKDTRYFVDFYARRKPILIGHNSIVYGRLNVRGRIVDAQVVGFFPDTDKYWAAYFFPMPGIIRREKANFTEPSAVIYRRYLTAAEFRRLNAKIRQVRAANPSWHLIFSNCNDFVGEIARSLGLLRPPTLFLPSLYDSMLRSLNDN